MQEIVGACPSVYDSSAKYDGKDFVSVDAVNNPAKRFVYQCKVNVSFATLPINPGPRFVLTKKIACSHPTILFNRHGPMARIVLRETILLLALTMENLAGLSRDGVTPR
jgi:hypothetical protein